MKICPRCKGEGRVNSPVQMGVCFRCDGLGDTDKADEQRAIQKEKMKKRDIRELQELIARAYLTLQRPRLIGGEKRKEQIRKETKAYANRLKEQYDIVLTLEDIQEISNTL